MEGETGQGGLLWVNLPSCCWFAYPPLPVTARLLRRQDSPGRQRQEQSSAGGWTSGRFEPNLAHPCVQATGYRTGSWAARGLGRLRIWLCGGWEQSTGVLTAGLNQVPGHFPSGWERLLSNEAHGAGPGGGV